MYPALKYFHNLHNLNDSFLREFSQIFTFFEYLLFCLLASLPDHSNLSYTTNVYHIYISCYIHTHNEKADKHEKTVSAYNKQIMKEINNIKSEDCQTQNSSSGCEIRSNTEPKSKGCV